VAATLLVVAARAREREVLGRVRPAVALREHVLDGGGGLPVARHDELRAAMNAFADESIHARVEREGRVGRDHGQDEHRARGHASTMGSTQARLQGPVREPTNHQGNR